MNVDPQVETLTAEQAGVSQSGLDAARAIFRLDGLAPFRASLHSDGYDQRAAVADWARVIDAALPATPRVIIRVDGGVVHDVKSTVPLIVSTMYEECSDEEEEQVKELLEEEFDKLPLYVA